MSAGIGGIPNGGNPAALAIIGAALVQHAHQQALAQQQGLHLGLGHQPGVAPGRAHAPGLQRQAGPMLPGGGQPRPLPVQGYGQQGFGQQPPQQIGSPLPPFPGYRQ